MKKIKLLLTSCAFLSAFVGSAVPSYITPDMLRALNPANFDADFSTYKQNTALFCAHLSDAAYLPMDKFVELESRLNTAYSNSYTITVIETSVRSRALFLLNKNFLVIAFRGTEFNEMKDILTDGKFKNYRTNDDSRLALHNLPTGHAGFRRGIMELINETAIFEKMDKLIASLPAGVSKLPIYLTGHSMGAAYASMFTGCLFQDKNYNFKGAYNFAPPLAIDCEEANSIRNACGSLIYDIVNYKDYVARAGSYCRRNYSHIGKFYRISDLYTLYQEDEHYVRFTRKEYGVKSLIEYHSLQGYINATGLDANTEAEIQKRVDAKACFFCNKDYNKVHSCGP